MEIITKYIFYKETTNEMENAINSQCNFYGQDEDYLHYFISCPYLKEFWVKIQQILKKSNIEHFVFAYKIFDKDYFDFNYFF
jgi:hypothetical protein